MRTFLLVVLVSGCDKEAGGGGKTDDTVSCGVLVDADGDGFHAAPTVDCDDPEAVEIQDCDDTLPTVHPGAEELCDGLDNDCDGAVEPAAMLTWYADADADGYGDSAAAPSACPDTAGYSSRHDDCDDTNTSVNPAATEICDSIDNDCDGQNDENDATDASTWYADTDGDGFGNPFASMDACETPAGYVADDTDCDDARLESNPDAEEYCNGEDDNCDGDVDEDTAVDAYQWHADLDGDLYGSAPIVTVSCFQPKGDVLDDTDCNDNVAGTYPGAEEHCDNVDNDCNGTLDDDTAADAPRWFADSDSDGYGDVTITKRQCSQPADYVLDAHDCDDTVGTTYPGADEYCNSTDDDCDSSTDEDGAVDELTWYADTDSDGYGDADVTDLGCDAPTGYVADDTDCDDADDTTYPGGTEVDDYADNDCNGLIDGAVSSGADWMESDVYVLGWYSTGFDDAGWVAANSPSPDACGDWRWYGIAGDATYAAWEHEDATTMWGTSYDDDVYLRKTFTIADVTALTTAMVTTSGDDDHVFYVNGTKLVEDLGSATGTYASDLTPYLVNGENVLAVRAVNPGGGPCGWFTIDGTIE